MLTFQQGVESEIDTPLIFFTSPRKREKVANSIRDR